MKFKELQQQKNIAILGRGREGKSSYTFLTEKLKVKKESITILDKKQEIKTPSGIKTKTGNTYLESLKDYDIILKSPGITKTLMKNKWGISTDNIDFLSQTQLFFDNYLGKIIGITGTKGKTTISTILYKSFQAYKKSVILAGNVGKPILDTIDFDNPPAVVVYELSSFMLEELENFSLDIGIFNTLYSTHTEEHGGYENYVIAKTKILHHSDNLLIGYQAEESLKNHLQGISYEVYGKQGKYNRKEGFFMKEEKILFNDKGILLPGKHNKHNICAIIGVFDIFMNQEIIEKNNWSGLQHILRTFSGVEHRIEYVGKYHDINRYNDAIATTPEASVAAIETFKEQINTLFYGGIEGEYNHEKVAKLIYQYKIKNLILFPNSGKDLKKLLDISLFTIYETQSMQEAVNFAKKHTEKGKIALLSCGSPSFSCRSGFEEKGNLFKKYVKEDN